MQVENFCDDNRIVKNFAYATTILWGVCGYAGWPLSGFAAEYFHSSISPNTVLSAVFARSTKRGDLRPLMGNRYLHGRLLFASASLQRRECSAIREARSHFWGWQRS